MQRELGDPSRMSSYQLAQWAGFNRRPMKRARRLVVLVLGVATTGAALWILSAVFC